MEDKNFVHYIIRCYNCRSIFHLNVWRRLYHALCFWNLWLHFIPSREPWRQEISPWQHNSLVHLPSEGWNKHYLLSCFVRLLLWSNDIPAAEKIDSCRNLWSVRHRNNDFCSVRSRTRQAYSNACGHWHFTRRCRSQLHFPIKTSQKVIMKC